jgi:hypothetical protein
LGIEEMPMAKRVRKDKFKADVQVEVTQTSAPLALWPADLRAQLKYAQERYGVYPDSAKAWYKWRYNVGCWMHILYLPEDKVAIIQVTPKQSVLVENVTSPEAALKTLLTAYAKDGKFYSSNPVEEQERALLAISGTAFVPDTINVLDRHGGFTAVTTKRGDTLWRPGRVLKGTTTGTLVPSSVKRKSFYQTNNDVTKALYKVPGYRYPIAVWFDNKTSERIA